MANKHTLKTIKNDETIYQEIKDLIHQTRNDVYHYANHKLVLMYWTIGKILYEKCGESEQGVKSNAQIATISRLLTEEFGKGFDQSNLRHMRQFYVTYPL